MNFAQCERRTKPEEKFDAPGAVIELSVKRTGRRCGIKGGEWEEPLAVGGVHKLAAVEPRRLPVRQEGYVTDRDLICFRRPLVCARALKPWPPTASVLRPAPPALPEAGPSKRQAWNITTWSFTTPTVIPPTPLS